MYAIVDIFVMQTVTETLYSLNCKWVSEDFFLNSVQFYYLLENESFFCSHKNSSSRFILSSICKVYQIWLKRGYLDTVIILIYYSRINCLSLGMKAHSYSLIDLRNFAIICILTVLKRSKFCSTNHSQTTKI